MSAASLRSSPASSPLKRPRLTSPVKINSPGKLTAPDLSPLKSGHSARDILSGALNEALKSRDVRAGGGDPQENGHADQVVGSSPSKNKGIRRKRRKGDTASSDYHHTFVMKLFDKSVDLAQFSPSTSLYPVCRAWMKNEPSNTNQAPRERTPTPPPPSSPAATANEEEEGGGGAGESKHVYSLPAPEPLDCSGEKVVCPRIPETGSAVLEGVDLELQGGAATTAPGILLSNHMIRWWEVRKSWKQAAATNEKRYHKSLTILQNMFDES